VSDLFAADARLRAYPLRTKISLHRLIRRAFGENRKWNERPSAGLRADAFAVVQSGSQFYAFYQASDGQGLPAATLTGYSGFYLSVGLVESDDDGYGEHQIE
jgi:hypothetical protein